MINTKSSHWIFLFCFFCCSNIKAQIIFEKGYIIDINNERKECLIKNMGWQYNPNEFEYKFSENSTVLKGTLTNIEEFGIDSHGKYIRKQIKIHRSEDRLQDLGFRREPEWSNETLFLRVLIEGKVTLFSYDDGEIQRFFYQKEGSDIEQLIHKSYRLKNSQKIHRNDNFKQQLWAYVNCVDRPQEKYRNLRYSRKELVQYFLEENNCEGGKFDLLYGIAKRKAFKLKITPGLKYSNASFSGSSGGATFQNELSFRLGLEVEFILPFNNNKWTVFSEPLYQSYYSKQNKQSPVTLLVDYKSIEVPIGIRYYIFIKSDLKLFFNGAYSFVYRLPSSGIRFSDRMENYLDVNTKTNLGFGLGATIRDRFSFEFRYHTPMKITQYLNWNSSFKSSSLIIGYTFFRK